MEHVVTPVRDDGRVFRLAYASRPVRQMSRISVRSLTNAAADSNRRRRVTGVLFSAEGIFLQWLEGSAGDVCGLMSRISQDTRHTEVTILSAGWMPKRRFPSWPMRLSEQAIPEMPTAPSSKSPPYDVDRAMIAFDQAAESHRDIAFEFEISPDRATDLAEALINSEQDVLPVLPHLIPTDLRHRAQLVDDICHAFAQGWRNDTWSSAQISLGLANLNRVWQRAGRVPDPIDARHSTSIVVPPGGGEMIGAIVKTDLLRAAGTSVNLVLETDVETTFESLSRSTPTTVIVTGSRVGLAGEQARSNAFAERVHARFPNLPIHVGGRASCPLREFADHIGFGQDATGEMLAQNVEWLALEAIANLASRPG